MITTDRIKIGNMAMELLPSNVCMLCEEKTSVLNSQAALTYTKFLQATFFDTNKYGLKEFQEVAARESLCVLCSYKVLISHKFKNNIEDEVKKQSDVKKPRVVCFLCKSKEDLVSTEDNPNDFITKIKAFMNFTSYPSPYFQSLTCFDCIFCLNVWFEVYSRLVKKLNIEEVLTNSMKESPKSSRKIQLAVSNGVSANKPNLALKKDKENVTPPSVSTEATSNKRLRLRNNCTVGARTQKLTTKVSQDNSSSGVQDTMKRNKTKVSSFNVFLKNSLQHLKPIKQVNNRAKWPVDVVNDIKFYKAIPYVLVSKNKTDSGDVKRTSSARVSTPRTSNGKVQEEKTKRTSKANQQTNEEGSRRSRRLNASPEVIDLCDSIEDDKQITVVKRKDSNANKNSLPQRAPFKIRLSKKFELNSGPKKGRKAGPKSAKQTNFCNVCDESFSLLCDYKRHSLWHEKPERLRVDATRFLLPTQIKASEFSLHYTKENSKTKKTVLSPTKINAIVKKYISEEQTVETFEDTDFNNSNEIDDIIGNLNSSDNEEKSKDSVSSKESNDTDLNKESNINDSQKKSENQNAPEQEETSNTQVPLTNCKKSKAKMNKTEYEASIKQNSVEEVETSVDDTVEVSNTHLELQESDSGRTSISEGGIQKNTERSVKLCNKNNTSAEVYENSSKEDNTLESDRECSNTEKNGVENEDEESSEKLSNVNDNTSANTDDTAEVNDIHPEQQESVFDGPAISEGEIQKNSERSDKLSAEIHENSSKEDESDRESNNAEEYEVDNGNKGNSVRRFSNENNSSEKNVSNAVDGDNQNADSTDTPNDVPSNVDIVTEENRKQCEQDENYSDKTSGGEQDLSNEAPEETENNSDVRDNVQDDKIEKLLAEIHENNSKEDESDGESYCIKEESAIDEQDLSNEAPEETENNGQVPDDEQDNKIEKLLAEIHGDVENEDYEEIDNYETTNDKDVEESETCYENRDKENGDIENEDDEEIDNFETANDRDVEDREACYENQDKENGNEKPYDKFSRKRRRNSDTDNDSSEDDSITQTPKKVRFAITYQHSIAEGKVETDRDREYCDSDALEENSLQLSDNDQ